MCRKSRPSRTRTFRIQGALSWAVSNTDRGMTGGPATRRLFEGRAVSNVCLPFCAALSRVWADTRTVWNRGNGVLFAIVAAHLGIRHRQAATWSFATGFSRRPEYWRTTAWRCTASTTDRADVKPQSKSTLAEDCRPPQAGAEAGADRRRAHRHPGRHRAQLGSVAAARAQAVVAALASDFGIDRARLDARGVSFLASMPPNTSEWATVRDAQPGAARGRRAPGPPS
jgi:hypothetical protein